MLGLAAPLSRPGRPLPTLGSNSFKLKLGRSDALVAKGRLQTGYIISQLNSAFAAGGRSYLEGAAALAELGRSDRLGRPKGGSG